ncbi:MAG: response regulator [Candidatus Competibacteraceae bacterium]
MPDEAAVEILIVDDTSANLRLLANLLAERGYRVRPASSGALALRSVAAKAPDLILLDVRMPDLDGYAVCQRLKADPDPNIRSIPVIFVSALHEVTDKVEGFAAGGVDYLTKPFDPAEVLARVQTHLELRRLRQGLERRVAARTAELAEANRALRESEARLRAAMESVPFDFFLIGPDGRYVLQNSASKKKWGDVIGKRPEDIARDPEMLARWNGNNRRAFAGEVVEEELCFTVDDGERCIYNVIAPVKDGDAIIGIVGLNIDITERKRAEAELERHREHLEELVAERTAELRQAMNQLVQSEKLAALGQLVAGVAHELNTPLGNARVVAGSLGETLRKFAAAVESGALRRSQVEGFLNRSREAVDLLERNAARAADLIGHFKEVAVDQTSMRRRRFLLRQTVEELLATLQPQFKRTTHRVEVDIPPDIELDSYPGPLEQVLANLVSNSLAHGFVGREVGTIRVGAASLGPDRVQIDYADDGAGIPEALHSHIFEPFFTTKLGSGGSGLGLYIVYNLVTGVLGGTVRLRSQPGQGAAFDLVLPAVASGSRPPATDEVTP